MGWLRLIECLKIQASFQMIGLFCRALLQKRPMFLSILLMEATPQREEQIEHLGNYVLLHSHSYFTIQSIMFYYVVHYTLLYSQLYFTIQSIIFYYIQLYFTIYDKFYYIVNYIVGCKNVLLVGYDAQDALKHRSLLQKSPTKETYILQKRLTF